MSTHVITPDESTVERALAQAITAEGGRKPATITELTREVFGDVGDALISGLISSVTLLKMAHLKVVGAQGADFLVFLAGVRLGQRLPRPTGWGGAYEPGTKGEAS